MSRTIKEEKRTHLEMESLCGDCQEKKATDTMFCCDVCDDWTCTPCHILTVKGVMCKRCFDYEKVKSGGEQKKKNPKKLNRFFFRF